MNRDKPPLFVLAGPTGVGKTELSLQLAKSLGGEILSGDSMQVYQGMDIGTAKLPKKDRQGIPHHLIDIRRPDEEFDVTQFQACAKQAMAEIRGRGKLPMLVGGTGFYLQALVRDIAFTEEAKAPEYVQELTDQFSQFSGSVSHWDIQGLFALLMEKDPEAAAGIPPENVKRVLRALEYQYATGEKFSLHNARERMRPSPYLTGFFVLELPRQELYERIDARVEEMLEEGLIEEARGLFERYGDGLSRTAREAIGYRELYACFRGAYPLSEAIRLIKRNTRHYAKRQLTWFNARKQVIRIEKQGKTLQELSDRILESWNTLTKG